MEKKHVIYQDIDTGELFDELKEENPDASDTSIWEMVGETLTDYFCDERTNLRSASVEADVIVFASLGLWNGRRPGYKKLGYVRALDDCLSNLSNADSAEWYVDGKGELRSTQVHHDGRNLLRYRAVRPGISDWAIESLLADYISGKDCEDRIKRYTYRLGDLAGDVYGWKFPNRPKAAAGRCA